jgi:hypothetical protein
MFPVNEKFFREVRTTRKNAIFERAAAARRQIRPSTETPNIRTVSCWTYQFGFLRLIRRKLLVERASVWETGKAGTSHMTCKRDFF